MCQVSCIILGTSHTTVTLICLINQKMTYQSALNETLKHFAISARDVATKSGIDEANFSSFRRGKKDLNLQTWERLIDVLPSEAKQYIYLKIFIGDLDNRGLSVILNAISLKGSIFFEINSLDKDSLSQIFQQLDKEAIAKILVAISDRIYKEA